MQLLSVFITAWLKRNKIVCPGKQIELIAALLSRTGASFSAVRLVPDRQMPVSGLAKRNFWVVVLWLGFRKF
ncbi:hypothetical protein AHMF7605_24025 [Adhaeribacter arboris]|uniref:Uncharacterized protein n=1 Tax=Adhaeribacter arboris TaxID=2072846 RepID=A0A2T2YLF5_9BACT|nr:hypothetical protein AHMF7605_24025 [Adhaeribacter arboris]